MKSEGKMCNGFTDEHDSFCIGNIHSECPKVNTLGVSRAFINTKNRNLLKEIL